MGIILHLMDERSDKTQFISQGGNVPGRPLTNTCLTDKKSHTQALWIHTSQTQPIIFPPNPTPLDSESKHPSVLPRSPLSLGSEESLSLNSAQIHLPLFIPAADTHFQILHFFHLGEGDMA